MFVIFAIIIFGLLIAVHEFGHFIAAKSLGVQVNEFALGMGPVVYQNTKHETVFSLRLLPVGGFCAMEGEDESSDNPKAFTSQSAWKRIIILAAGSFMNFLTGFLIACIIFSHNSYFVTRTIDGFLGDVEYSGASGIQPGDTIVGIDGEHIWTNSDFDLVMSRSEDDYYDIRVIRDGKPLLLEELHIYKQDFDVEGQQEHLFGMKLRVEEKNALNVLKYSWFNAMDFVKMVRLGLTDLISGNAGFNDMSGVVGIVDTMNEVGTQSETITIGFLNVGYLGAFIAVNLAVMNMLPLPALDGGRVFFLIITELIERITRRKLDPKYEGYIHMAGLFLLLGLMLLVTANDILKLIGLK
ncbi:MAG: RIP metalloprotease RseP [Ruminococcaceae bacterium]|nr:RIP metalloprotease RseP [Oscillospiraceae bacterium]